MAGNTKRISHEGIIEKISEGNVYVHIVQSSACAGCKIASHCSSAESKKKTIEIKNINCKGYSVGDKVNVIASESAGTTAVLFGFIFPFIVLVSTIFTTYYCGMSETIAALAGLSALIPYYIILYLFRNYFHKIISFTIE